MSGPDLKNLAGALFGKPVRKQYMQSDAGGARNPQGKPALTRGEGKHNAAFFSLGDVNIACEKFVSGKRHISDLRLVSGFTDGFVSKSVTLTNGEGQ